MFCEKCGTQNPDGAKFCRSCGAPMPAAAPQPMNTGYAPQPGMGTMPGTNPVRELLRALGTGPLFLTGAIAYSVGLLFQLTAAFQPDGGIAGILSALMHAMPNDVWYYAEEYGIDISETIGAAQTGSFLSILFSTLFMMLPAILTAVSIWLIFAAVRDTTGKPIGTAGFTILKVLTILGIVGEALLLIISEILLCVVASFVAEYSSDSSATPLFILIMVAVAIGFALAILYGVFLVRTLGTMSYTAQTLIPSGKVSVYVAVICFINAVFMLFGILLSGGIFNMLNVLCMVVAQVAFGILLLNYRSRMKVLSGGQ